MRRAAQAPLLLLLTGLMLQALAPPARAQALVADLTSHLVAITTGFTGTSVVLFGATDGGGDVIVVVRGPEREMVVRHKSKVAAIWVNTRQATFTNVPSFYSVYSSRPVEEIASPAVRQLHQIGLDYLHLNTEQTLSAEEATDFRAAFIRNQVRSGLYLPTTGQVAFLGDRLFRATINFPASVPTGTYLVEVFLVRDNAVVSGQTTPLVISEIGIDAEVHDFADRYGLAYGLVAVILAAMAGWLASLPFRNA
ncbi:MAG TPA: TIGR02186 family protein [Stellaceae bacterium]|nr:TIGR02186 family protein [Stellaceae bacterium]